MMMTVLSNRDYSVAKFEQIGIVLQYTISYKVSQIVALEAL
jgi:hypothetical protein